MAKRASAVLVMAAVVLTGVTNAGAALTDGLISYWSFDSASSTVANDSAGSNDGTIYGALPATGIIGSALSFDGVNNYVSIGDKDNLDFNANSSFSIAAWVKTTNEIAAIVTKIRNVGQFGGFFEEGYSLLVHSNKLHYSHKDIYYNTISIYGDTVINDGFWHHVAVVRDVSTDMIYLYVDGSLDRTPVIDPAVGTLETTQSFAIGRRAYYGEYFGGMIDDVRVYGRALSAAEITELYLIPEPATILLFGLGGLFLRKKR